jgi:hypothetical protein
MSITKTLINAIPTSEDGKVVSWYVDMQYEKGTEGNSDYFKSVFRKNIPSVRKKPSTTINNFTPKAEADWSKADILAVCPIALWDEVFDNQYEQVITNPEKEKTSNTDYVIPD